MLHTSSPSPSCCGSGMGVLAASRNSREGCSSRSAPAPPSANAAGDAVVPKAERTPSLAAAQPGERSTPQQLAQHSMQTSARHTCHHSTTWHSTRHSTLSLPPTMCCLQVQV